jgi:hypothetical protein
MDRIVPRISSGSKELLFSETLIVTIDDGFDMKIPLGSSSGSEELIFLDLIIKFEREAQERKSKSERLSDTSVRFTISGVGSTNSSWGIVEAGFTLRNVTFQFHLAITPMGENYLISTISMYRG